MKGEEFPIQLNQSIEAAMPSLKVHETGLDTSVQLGQQNTVDERALRVEMARAQEEAIAKVRAFNQMEIDTKNMEIK